MALTDLPGTYAPLVVNDRSPILETVSDGLVGINVVQVPSARLASSRKTILLVEDEPALRDFMSLMLRSAGYAVLEAESPVTAIKLAVACHEPIHLLLTDAILPAMNGVELSALLRTVRPDLKVIFVSGYHREDLVRQVSLAPDAVLVEKPFSKQVLLTRIHSILDD